jgi:heat shock protein HtpX
MNNILKTTFLLSLLTILLVAMGGAVGGKGGMIVAFLMAAVMNFGSYWFYDKIVLKMYNAQEITREVHPSFYSMVERLAARAGLPMPKVYLIPDESPNAFATGRNPEHAALPLRKEFCGYFLLKNWKGSWPMNWLMLKTVTF